LEGFRKVGRITKAWNDFESLEEGFRKVGRISEGWKASK
jgi:hypothetical protein